jgi:hypothetical protein
MYTAWKLVSLSRSPGTSFTAMTGRWRLPDHVACCATGYIKYIHGRSDMTVEAPTTLGSYSVPGTGLSTLPGNLTWSDDGQAAFFTTRGVHILVSLNLIRLPSISADYQTPHLYTSLPPPPAHIEQNDATADPSSAAMRQSVKIEDPAVGEDESMEDNDENGAGPSSRLPRRIRRPVNGEVGWYVNGVDIKEVNRTEIYGWTEVGGKSNAPVRCVV